MFRGAQQVEDLGNKLADLEIDNHRLRIDHDLLALEVEELRRLVTELRNPPPTPEEPT